MRGHIIKRGKKYSIVVDVGRDHNNKRKQKWFSGYEKKSDAEDDLPIILAQIKKGYKEPNVTTLKEYFTQWLDRKRKTVAPGTYEHYESYMRKHIIPGLGWIEIKDLDPIHIESFMDEIEGEEKRNTF